MSSEDETRRLVRAVTDFLQNELHRVDLSNEDRDNLRTCIECLEIVYGLQDTGYSFRRSLLDMYTQVANPVTVKDKVNAEISKNSGNEKMSQEMYQEAEADYTRAIQLDKWNSIYYCNRAAARIKLGQHHDAILDCRRALELNPDYAKAYGRMGQAYVQLDRPRSAVSCFQQAARLEPENPQHQNNLQVAQRQVAERSNSGLDGFFNSLLGILTRRGPSMGPAEGGRLNPFMILSDPQRSDNCPHHSRSSSSDTENTDDQQTVEAGDQPEGREDQTVLIRMYVGVPTYSLMGDGTDEEEGTLPNHPVHSIFTHGSAINEESGNESCGESSSSSGSENSEYTSADSDPFKEMVDRVSAEIRNSNEQRGSGSNSEERQEEPNPGGSGEEGEDKENTSKDAKKDPQKDK